MGVRRRVSESAEPARHRDRKKCLEEVEHENRDTESPISRAKGVGSPRIPVWLLAWVNREEQPA